uniref:ZP domain-containing protein n=1 Tax=Brugia timori TaxID=42155 RepID=A0A0R3QGJ7_9BILA
LKSQGENCLLSWIPNTQLINSVSISIKGTNFIGQRSGKNFFHCTFHIVITSFFGIPQTNCFTVNA